MGLLGFAPPQGLPSGGGGGSGVTIEDEGTSQGSATTLNFTGAGVSATVAAGEATITISGSSLDPANSTEIFDDFYMHVAAASGDYGPFWVIATAGAGSPEVDSIAGETNHPGIIECTTGTGTGSLAGIRLALRPILFGGGECSTEWLINIPTLSDATDEYDLYIGFTDAFGGTAPVDGAYFKYDRNTSTNWIRGTSSNSTATETATSTAVATGWTKLKVVVNAGGTSVEYFVNGSSVGSNTTNIPTASGRETSCGFIIIKSAGTTARVLRGDYARLNQSFTTAR